jgi:hypothetical protein
MPETSPMEFDLLVRRADAAGFYVNRHRSFDPLSQRGDLYLMPKRKIPGERPDTVLKFTTADEIHKWLHEYQR